MKKRVKWILAGLAVLICAAVFAAVSFRPVSVKTEQVLKGSLKKQVTVQAFITPEHSMILNTAVAGTVTKLPFEEGEKAGAGEVIAFTDAVPETSLKLQKEQAEEQLSAARREYERLYGESGSARSEYEGARSEYELAEKSYQNGKVLADGGYLAPAELDELRTKRDLLRQKLLQAEENNSESSRRYALSKIESCERQLAVLENAAEPGTVRMPYDGVLWELFAENGTYLPANQPVARVYSREGMKLEAQLLSEDAAGIEPGTEAFILYADQTEATAEVLFVSNTAVQKTSAVGLLENRRTVRLLPGEMPEKAGAGQTVDVTFTIVRAENVLTVPSSSIVPSDGKSVVYVIRDGRAQAVEVKTGRKESGRVEIVSGLEEGDRISSAPYDSHLRSGIRVSIQDIQDN